MVDAMLKVGFLSKVVDGYEVTDWLDHNGHLAMFKRRAKQAAHKRWGTKDATSNATSNAKEQVKHYPVPTVPTVPIKEQADPNCGKPVEKIAAKKQAAVLDNKEVKDQVSKTMRNLTQAIRKKTQSKDVQAIVKQTYGVMIGFLKTNPNRAPELRDEIDRLPQQMDIDWYVCAIRGIVNRFNGEIRKQQEDGSSMGSILTQMAGA
jgi:hypothetical protein